MLPEEAVPDGLVGVQEVQEGIRVLAQAGGEENHLKQRKGRVEKRIVACPLVHTGTLDRHKRLRIVQ